MAATATAVMSTTTTVVTTSITSRSHTAVVNGLLVCVDGEEFLRALDKYQDNRSPLVHGMVGVLAKKHVYAFSVRGLVVVYCGSQSLPVAPDVEAENIVFPESWRCCKK